MRPTRFPPPGLVRLRSAARPLTGLMAPLTGGRPRFQPIMQTFTASAYIAGSALERFDRAPQRSAGDQQLAFGFVDRDDDVLALTAEERSRQRGDAFAMPIDRVGDDVQFGCRAGRIVVRRPRHAGDVIPRSCSCRTEGGR